MDFWRRLVSSSETHPLTPYVPQNARLFLLGSFPPPRERWAFDFYYPNPNNDMWRILPAALLGDASALCDAHGAPELDKITLFLTHFGIAVGDAAYKVTRLQDDAKDKYLQVDAPLDLAPILRTSAINALLFTGAKAHLTLAHLIEQTSTNLPRSPKMGHVYHGQVDGIALAFARGPSSSRAYPLAFDQKVDVYRSLLASLLDN